MEFSECGLVSLLMILSYYGTEIPLPDFREKYMTPRGGFSLYELYLIAEMENLNPKSYQVALEDIPQEVLPCIIYCNNNHFAVLVKKTNRKYIVYDPASGKQRLIFSQLKEKYSGAIMTFSPDEKFKPIKVKKENIIKELFLNNKFKLFLILLLTLVFQGILLMFPILTRKVTDSIPYMANLNVIRNLMIQMVGFFGGYFIISLIRGMFITNIENFMDKDIMTRFIEKLVHLQYNFFENRSNADIIMRANSGTMIRDILTNRIITLFIDMIMVITYIVLLLTYSPALTGLLVGMSLLMVIIIAVNSKIINRKVEKNLDERVDVQNIISEMVYNIIDIKTMAVEKDFIDKWSIAYEKELATQKEISQNSVVINSLLAIINSFIPLSLLIVGGVFINRGIISFGILMAFNISAGTLVNTIIALSSYYSSFLTARIYFQRILDIINSKAETDNFGTISSFENEDIVFRNVSFKYNKFGEETLKNLNFEIKSGETVAFVGVSGSGKSTLLKLLMGIYKKDAGEIFIGGKSVENINMLEFRRKSGIIFQESQLFSGTIKENILMNRKIGDEMVVEAAAKAMILDEILEMPLKFETKISQQGMNFSGGQRQRLIIARAIAGAPKWLIFDEATSNIDGMTEKVIYENLKSLNATKIIVAHRLSTIKSADKIFFINDGKIVEEGTHDTLMQKKGYYYQLYSGEENIY